MLRGQHPGLAYFYSAARSPLVCGKQREFDARGSGVHDQNGTAHGRVSLARRATIQLFPASFVIAALIDDAASS
jgi:hypothetical protein